MYEFDFKTLLRTMLNAKRRILLNCVIASAIGVVVAVSIPKEYVSECTLASEGQDGSMGGMGGLGNLASMVGVNMMRSADAIGPDLYPNVVSSRRFLVDLLYVDVRTTDDETLTFYDYLLFHSKSPWWSSAFKAMANGVKGLFGTEEGEEEKGRIDPERMTREEERFVDGLRGVVACRINDIDNTIDLSVRLQDPLVAKSMVDTVRVHLQDFIISYRTSKACHDLEYYREMEQEALRKYEQCQKEYALYSDSHQGTLLKTYSVEQDRLENEVNVALTMYTQMRQQVQMAEAKVQEKTPVFTIVESSSVPTRHSSPKKMLIVLACGVLALLGTCGWIYVKLLFSKPKEG